MRTRPAGARWRQTGPGFLDLGSYLSAAARDGMQVTVGSAYFPRITDQLRYYTSDKVLFRFVRKP